MKNTKKSEQTCIWLANYKNAVTKLSRGKYTGEQIRIKVQDVIGEPHHPNMWGSAFNSVLKTKKSKFKPTGSYTAMLKESSHGRATQIYWKRS